MAWLDRAGDGIDRGQAVLSVGQSGHEAQIDARRRLGHARHVFWRKLAGYQDGGHLEISSDSPMTMTSNSPSSGSATVMPSPSAVTAHAVSLTSARAAVEALAPRIRSVPFRTGSGLPKPV